MSLQFAGVTSLGAAAVPTISVASAWRLCGDAGVQVKQSVIEEERKLKFMISGEATKVNHHQSLKIFGCGMGVKRN